MVYIQKTKNIPYISVGNVTHAGKKRNIKNEIYLYSYKLEGISF